MSRFLFARNAVDACTAVGRVPSERGVHRENKRERERACAEIGRESLRQEREREPAPRERESAPKERERACAKRERESEPAVVFPLRERRAPREGCAREREREGERERDKEMERKSERERERGRFSRSGCAGGWVLGGWPRSTTQGPSRGNFKS